MLHCCELRVNFVVTMLQSSFEVHFSSCIHWFCVCAGKFQVFYPADDETHHHNLRVVPFTWCAAADVSTRWDDEISVEAGSEIVLRLEANDQYMAPLTVPGDVLNQRPVLSFLDAEARPLNAHTDYVCAEHPEIDAEKPQQAVIRATFKRAGRYRLYCPYPGDEEQQSEHHLIKVEGEAPILPLTWHLHVRSQLTILFIR